MIEIKERIKDFIGDIYFKWIIGKIKPQYNGPKEGNILLLPPSDLDGSFGDELMVKSFIANFSEPSQITIFTDHLIRRNDFLGQYSKVKYQNGFQVRNYRRWVEQLKNASAVFIIGADALDGSYSSRHSMRFLRLAEFAQKMNIPVYFSGFSVSKNWTDVTKEAMQTVAKYSLLKARDLDTYDRLLQYIPKEHILQVSDMAFICPYNPQVEKTPEYQRFEHWVSLQHAESRKIIAFCPNSIQAEKIGWDEYRNGVAKLLHDFQDKTKVSIVYLYHDTRPLHGQKSDLDISQDLFESSVLEDQAHCFFTGNIENGVALKSYLKLTDFTITGRMHFGISGLAAGKPMFGICYANKFEGMLRLFDIDPANALVDYTDLENGDKIIDLFLQDIENQYKKIEENIEKITYLSILNGKDITDAR